MHFLKSTQSKVLQRGRSRPKWQWCLCWVLCLSVWRGPVPVVHAHDLDLQSLGNNAQLAEHAIECHAGHLGEESAGLHLHFLMLDVCATALFADVESTEFGSQTFMHADTSELLEGLTTQPLADLSLLSEQAFGKLVAEACIPSQVSFRELAILERPVTRLVRCESNFLQTQFGASTCVVLCVFLC